MKIVKLKAENIKKLVAVEITPNGNLVKITGKNAAGKTSVLDSIFWALGGSENIQEQPVRQGETKAKVELDMGEIIVRRSFNSLENGTTTALTIENKDGLRFKSPQTMLDGLLGRLAFDPLEFMRQEPRRQFETLRALTGIDFSKLDGMRQKTYDERTAVNREVQRLNVQAESITIPVGAPTAEISANDVIEKIKEAGDLEKEKRKWEAQVSAMNEEVGILEQGIVNERDDIKIAERQIAEAKEKIRQNEENIESLAKTVNEITEKARAINVPDISVLQAELSQVEEKNKAARAYLHRQEIQRNAIAEKERSEGLTTQIEEIDKQKADMIAAAKFPLEGLGFGNGAVIYNGLPLSQAASSEQLRVSMAMAMALNPKLRVIRITDGSLLDSSSMKIVEEMANGQDYQVWIEQVDETGKVGIVIEDGKVAAVN